MIDRRSVLRVASLSALATPLLAACGGGGRDDGSMSGSALVASDLARVSADPTALSEAAASVQAFAAGLWSRLLPSGGDNDGAGDHENLAISPYSIAVALAMTLNGAVGDTRDEMLEVLHADSEQALNRGLNALTQYVESLAAPKLALDAANQLFGQRGVSWERAFLDVLARQYGAGLRVVDFAGAAEAARRAVNSWTAARTHDRIEEILPAGSVNAMTRLVLVNALYFKAPWLEPFEEALTEDGDFHLGNGQVARVPTMHAVLEQGASATGDGWSAVRIPYRGGAVAMTVVLPDRGRDVEVAELPAILAAPRPGGVDLTLPRWTFRAELSLSSTLAQLGMPTAFDEARADFTRMTDSDEHLLIDDVFHQAFVAVDERGTEAAAATAVVMRTTSAAVPELTLVVDRPFVFVIHDVQHGTPLFLGRVVDPRG